MNPDMSTIDSQRPGLGRSRPSLMDSKRTSSRRLVDFDSEQLLSMEEIRDNVRLTASRLLNDDLDSSDEEDDDYEDHHEQLPHPEDARIYAGRLLKKENNSRSLRMEKLRTIRQPMYIVRSLQAMKDMRGISDKAFSSDVDAMSIDMDIHEQMPRKKRLSKHTLYCMLGTLALVAITATILAFFSKGNSDDNNASPSVTSSVSSSPPQDQPAPPKSEASPRSESIINMLVKIGISESKVLNSDGAPQRLAVDWLSNEDTLQYDPTDDESRLI